MKKITQTEAAIIKMSIADKIALLYFLKHELPPAKEKNRIIAMIDANMTNYYYELLEGLNETI